ncbi:MAG: cobalt-precorrin-5B (C(1))-methyltransferase [Syntrophobacteraceae bacterium]|nr:cobalt-precorrin-5B (C(1))-methyltransferase [Syntrophobacteraceae bacterium]
MESGSSKTRSSAKRGKRQLRQGFSTGTAIVAAARAALRFLMTGQAPKVIAVRLPLGYYLPIDIRGIQATGTGAWASVIKDGGDDPDVTHKAELRALVHCFAPDGHGAEGRGEWYGGPSPVALGQGICVVVGEGVGVVTKAGLPVTIGEPAINPVPRQMLSTNLSEELLGWPREGLPSLPPHSPGIPPGKPHALIPFCEGFPKPVDIALLVEISVPEGAALARKTLNPRLGILGGISILGTTGLVKPFSHEAYEETIHAALSVAAATGCREVVLSTGGKSEQFARRLLGELPEEAFVQIADFFAYGVGEARRMGFKTIVHSVFFGKVLKMGQGHPYTHAHRVSLDLKPLAELAREKGYGRQFCEELASANTARHALQLLVEQGDFDIVRETAAWALQSSLRFAGGHISVRVLLFDYDGNLMADVGS